MDNIFTLDEVVQFPIHTLTNTDDNTFWWKTSGFKDRFKHEDAKVGQKFVDGNNGDSWLVLAADTAHKRLVIRNVSQDWLTPAIVMWD